jgi:folate-binding protein YgfZ
MFDLKLADALKQAGAVLSDGTAVEHFGDAEGELLAATGSVVGIPLAEFCRIRVTGADRAKFLHNFCTNEIKELQQQRACEVFFTDVKAHVMAHGYVLSGPEFHEIWMLPGDETALINHLSRYVITEDVSIESISDEHVQFVLAGPDVIKQDLFDAVEPGEWADRTITVGGQQRDVCVMTVKWAGIPLSFVSVSAEQAGDVWQAMAEHSIRPAGEAVFRHLRVLERYPCVGQDMTSEHLVPEAGRNESAISYHKGCYLGQEPIARIDALGHVNRELKRLRVQADEADESAAPANATTISTIDDAGTVALAIVRLANVDAEQRVAISVNGTTKQAQLF